MTIETDCKDDPRAPHGFCRNESHTQGRYVCECEFWTPPETAEGANVTTPFEQWYDGLVGFHVNSERLIYDLYPQENGYPDPVTVRKWMVVCWNQALEAAQNSLGYVDYYYDNGNKWNDDCYSSCDPRQYIEDLKEKP